MRRVGQRDLQVGLDAVLLSAVGVEVHRVGDVGDDLVQRDLERVLALDLADDDRVAGSSMTAVGGVIQFSGL